MFRVAETESLTTLQSELARRKERATLYGETYTHAQWIEFIDECATLANDLEGELDTIHEDCISEDQLREAERDAESRQEEVEKLEARVAELEADDPPDLAEFEIPAELAGKVVRLHLAPR